MTERKKISNVDITRLRNRETGNELVSNNSEMKLSAK